VEAGLTKQSLTSQGFKAGMIIQEIQVCRQASSCTAATVLGSCMTEKQLSLNARLRNVPLPVYLFAHF
jgi:predicted metal-dependent hydrolase